MSRSGYSDDIDNWAAIKWRGIITSATRGKRGQAFFRDLVAALDAMPVKRLIRGYLKSSDGEVCALGACGVFRGVSMDIDPEDHEIIGTQLDIAPQLAQEVAYMNDDDFCSWRVATPEYRWQHMREWARAQILERTP